MPDSSAAGSRDISIGVKQLDKETRERLRRELAKIPPEELIIDIGHGPEPASNYSAPEEFIEPLVHKQEDTAGKYLDFFRDDLDPGKQIHELIEVMSNGTGILFEDEMEFFNLLLLGKMFPPGDITGVVIEEGADGQKKEAG